MQELTSQHISHLLQRNVVARSDIIEACLLMMPNAMAMTPDDILELLPSALHGCRLQVVKYLSV